jgi:hypothetical protein
MMLVPITDAHVLEFKPQRAQSEEACDPEIRLRTTRALKAQGSAWAAVAPTGEVLALAGVSEQWEGRGMAWCLLSEDAAKHMVGLTRIARRYFSAVDYRRLEMYVDAQFAAGCRWAELLGFKNETPGGMVGFLPNGNRAFMYGRGR